MSNSVDVDVEVSPIVIAAARAAEEIAKAAKALDNAELAALHFAAAASWANAGAASAQVEARIANRDIERRDHTNVSVNVSCRDAVERLAEALKAGAIDISVRGSQ